MASAHLRKPVLLVLAAAICLIAMLLAACSPEQAPNDDNRTDQADSSGMSSEFTWSETSDCTACHGNAAASFDDAACTASLHANQKDDCFSCHDDKDGLAKAHEKVTLDSKKKKASLKKTEIGNDTCIPYHDATALADATASATVLTDKNSLTVNPHALPEHEDHADITCSSCHKIHAPEGPAETAPAVCRNCHHADVYECNTCHVEK